MTLYRLFHIAESLVYARLILGNFSKVYGVDERFCVLVLPFMTVNPEVGRPTDPDFLCLTERAPEADISGWDESYLGVGARCQVVAHLGFWLIYSSYQRTAIRISSAR